MANSIVLFLPFLVLYCAFSPAATSLNNETDLLSLLAIKSVVEDPLGSLSSWNQTTHFCNWTGIRCGRRHPDRVVGLNLRSYGLVGSLSPHLGNLSFLRLILLQNNTFRGPIPQEISLLKRLETVEFSNNSFTGAIPKNLSKTLVYLNLIDNKLSGSIPTEIGSMFKLEQLGLSFNKVSGPIPPSIGNLTSLNQLSLKSCGLKGEIPASFARLQRLEFLQVGGNDLTGTIPSGVFNISAIQYFVVYDNQLYGVLPSTLGLTLPNLVGLYLGKNQLEGRIPASISNASLLEHLELDTNYFIGQIPTTLGRLTHLQTVVFASNRIEDDINFISSFMNSTNLETLEVDDNLLTGSILPNSVANFSSQLSWLSLTTNKVHGKIPSTIGNLIGLTVIGLNDNYLEGPIPPSFAKLSDLQLFAAAANIFADELPSFIGNLTSLLYLYLDGNKFSGSLTPCIGNCTRLLEADFSNNNFNGLIPPEIMSISSLSSWLDLSYNLFEGSIPNEVGSLRNLAGLDLSYNRLSGPIPGSLSLCSSLQVLDMHGNLLEGEIPSALSTLSGLQNLSLSQNNLSGPIPTFLGNLDLQYLNLSFNRLQGEVPTIGIFRNKTLVSLDGNKELCGGISELKLPPCPQAESHRKSLSSLLKILIPVFAATGIFAIVLAAFIYKQRICRKNVASTLFSFNGVQIMRLSYADLLKATCGFSEANLIGCGRFGSVYKGILGDGHTEIAVKVLNLSVRGASRSFTAECSALRNVRHRNLLKILSVCESIDFQGNNFKALVYEFKVNGSLEQWLHQGEQNAERNNLNMMQRLSIVVAIAEGIKYLHSGTDLCIVHGDLKPSNILLDCDMTAYVGDFGLSKFISDIIPSLESNSSIGIRGTIGYVPPEYGMSCPISMQGDAYSYGIILLEMFTNKRPTDDMFGDHLNLHCFANAALPDRVMEVVDPQFRALMDNGKIKDCMASIRSIGVSCSNEIPRERMSMTNVVNEWENRVFYPQVFSFSGFYPNSFLLVNYIPMFTYVRKLCPPFITPSNEC